jgi:chromosome partitioning protein
MKIYCLAIQKGGVGKTSLSLALAGELANYGKTLLIDADPQGNTTGQLLPNVESELADLLFDIAATPPKNPDLTNTIKNTGFPGLSIIQTAGLDGRLRLYSETLAMANPWAMDNLLKMVEGFDYCVIDTSPAFSGLEQSALLAADEVITPLMGDTYGSDGLKIFAEHLEGLKRRQRANNPAYNKILFNAYDKRITSHEKILNELKAEVDGKMDIYCFPTDPIYRKAQDKQAVIQELSGAKAETIAELNRLANDLR